MIWRPVDAQLPTPSRAQLRAAAHRFGLIIDSAALRSWHLLKIYFLFFQARYCAWPLRGDGEVDRVVVGTQGELFL
jgi:hypothetical protein